MLEWLINHNVGALLMLALLVLAAIVLEKLLKAVFKEIKKW